MFFHQLRYEWLQLVRERWVGLLLIFFLLLCLFAVSNGVDKTARLQAEVQQALPEQYDRDANIRKDIDSVERGVKKPEPWLNPRRLNYVGNRSPRVAAKPPTATAFLSTGQSDLYSHTVKTHLYVNMEAYAASFTELANPVQLLFGSFDLAFVILYLLPLLALAFTYNLLSAERESGSLRLILSQPVQLFEWLLTRTFIRFLILGGIVCFSILASSFVAGIPMGKALPGLSTVLLLTLIYLLFWFLLALLVNAFGWGSGTNAVTLISSWVVIVLLLPTIIAQVANSLYPVPSRVNFIHEMRVAKAEAEKDADKILAGYYRDHPELAPQDSTAENQYSFYLGYFSSLDVVKKSVAPLLEQYETQLSAQRTLVERFRFLSPALLMQDALNDVAGNSPRHYEAYRSQVIAFADSWRNYFLPRMFRNEWMTGDDLDKLPSFTYREEAVEPSRWKDAAGLFFMVIVVAAGSAFAFRKKLVLVV